MEHLQSYNNIGQSIPSTNTNRTGMYGDSYDSFGSYSFDSGSYSEDSDTGSPVLGTGNNSLSPKKQLFLDTSSFTSGQNDRKSSFRILIVLTTITVLCLFLFSKNQTVVNNRINHPEPKIIQLPIDWWDKYSTNCCIMKNVSNIYRNSDCSADGTCHRYLKNWLTDNNQNFYNSTWSNKCCYEYRPIGSKSYKIYCSYTCLNTFTVGKKK